MIRATHGFDDVDAVGVGLQFDASHYNDFGTAQIFSGAPGTGSGNALFIWFNSFGANYLTRIFDPQTMWTVGLNASLYYNTIGPGPAVQELFLELGDSTGAMVGLQFEADGSISIRDLIHGLQVARTSSTFAVGVWNPYLELKCSGFGSGSVTCQLYSNDTLACSGTLATSRLPDRVSLVQNIIGVMFDNVVILDGQGAAPWNDRLGPVRLTTITPAANGTGSWPVTGGVAAYSAVWDQLGRFPDAQTPDGDTTYLAPVALGAQQTFQLGSAACYGLILGISANMCFRGTSGSATVDALLIEGAGVYDLGSLSWTGAAYRTLQVFTGLSPASGSYFNDAEIAGNLWGFKTNTSPDLRVTQFYLEKIVSLRNVPYQCGQNANYSF